MYVSAETPEGHSVGLVKNLSLLANISVGVPPGSLLEFLDEWGVETLEYVNCRDIAKMTKIFVNGMLDSIETISLSYNKYLQATGLAYTMIPMI